MEGNFMYKRELWGESAQELSETALEFQFILYSCIV